MLEQRLRYKSRIDSLISDTMSNMEVLERKEFRERERTNREQIHRDTMVRS